MISDKLKNALNKLPPHLGNLHLGTILKNMADSVDASAAAVEGLTTYSETPVRIGTWGGVDGSPVYRKAFDVLLKDMDAADYGDILATSAFTEVMNESGSAYPIYTFCAYADANDALYTCSKELSNTAIEFGIPLGVTIPEDQSDCTTERYYGYIDFIKTG